VLIINRQPATAFFQTTIRTLFSRWANLTFFWHTIAI
jgi:hypothetical protein